MYVKTQKFLVLGVSKSGNSACEYLLKNGATCFIYEEIDNEKIRETIQKLISLGAKLVLKEEVDEIIEQIDVVVISPGVPMNHSVAIKAKEHQKRIVGELEFGFLQFLPTIVAVTGTNGKTTTVSLIDCILKENNCDSKLLGNVGVPVTSEMENINKDTVCVTEVSSFQLESVNAFCPHIACVLNIAPDHLERHYTMDNYVYLKKRIFKNQRESEYTVLNYDDEVVREFAKESRGKIIFVSNKEKVNGVYCLEDKIYYNGEYVIDENEIKLSGEHNLYDSMFAIAVCKLLNVNNEVICNALKEFKGVKHRIEFIGEINGVKYYDDSKSTNTASAMTAIDTMKTPFIIILGGSEKGESYKELFKKLKQVNVKQAIITGASKYNMIKDAEEVGFIDYTATENFAFAVKIASTMAMRGESVLLSPACASFDKFSGFEERGDCFNKEVGKLRDKE